MSKGLYDELKKYGESDIYPFHMPGHKRSLQSGALADFYQMDITEIDGFDNLHQPESIIKDAQKRAAELYHSEETYFLINGSTAGILSAVSAVAGKAGSLIIARNCHKAVYHAAFLNRFKLYYIYPETIEEYGISGSVQPENLKNLIDNILFSEGNDKKKPSEVIAGIVVTSPTYEGIASDINRLVKVAHSYNLPIIVDQAHGAHFGIHPAYPESAVWEGADLVIHSIHKTLPAPTQTALIHRNGVLTDREQLKKYLRIYQSSSPSYLLMAGIDEAIRIVSQEGYDRLESLFQRRSRVVNALKNCRYIQICPETEPGKLVIFIKNCVMTGHMLYEVLRNKYHLQMEMEAGNYVIAILSMMDCEEGVERLNTALLDIDAMLVKSEGEKNTVENKKEKKQLPDLKFYPEVSLDLWEAYRAPYEEVEIEKAQGRTAAEFINLYPPGIPLLVPGEIWDNKMIQAVQTYQENGYVIQGIYNNKIKVII